MRLLLSLPLLAACAAPAPYGPLEEGSAWTLLTLDGASFPGRATLVVDGGEVRGQGPCNAWSAPLYAGSDGAMSLGPVTATEMACHDLALEAALFAALGQATRIERRGDELTVRAPGQTLVFTR
jgi:heat shock protein HslJ